MKVKGLDRVAIVVRDMDKAIEFFSNKLGAEFQELPGGEAMGMRVGISIDNQMELVSPILPLPEGAPPRLTMLTAQLSRLRNRGCGLKPNLIFRKFRVGQYAT